MKKITSLFKRDYEGTRLVYDEVTPGAEWVQNGEGVATNKLDGTSCMIKEGKLYRRYDVKKGRTKPEGFIPAQEPDEVTGHWPGWVAVNPDSPADRYHIEALESFNDAKYKLPDGTYELIGEKINGNPHNRKGHTLVNHINPVLNIIGVPTEYNKLREWLDRHNLEGIVWHHPDGRMVKIKKKDFGLEWPKKEGAE